MTEEQKKQYEIKQDREKLIVKGNDLITHTRYDLSLTEQKLLIYVISKIIAEDKDFKHITFKISDYCSIAGLKRNGKEYNHIKDGIQNLSDKSWWIKNNNKEQLFRWVDTATIEENKGSIDIVLSESLKPYLLDIKGNFTKYELINVLVLHSKYSVRLYEIFKSFLWLNYWEISVDDFKERLSITNKYKNFGELKRNVITPSLKEINKYTDLNIELATTKKGKFIDKLLFKISEKEGVQMMLDLIHNQDERLKIEN